MRLVKQEYPTSCGIACVAMLAERMLLDVPLKKRHQKVFDKASEILKRKFSKTNSYTDRRAIKKLLKEFKVSWQKDFKCIDQDLQSQGKFWNSLKGINLVAVRFRIKNKTEYWHWIVTARTKKCLKIYDPNPKKLISCIYLNNDELPNQKSYCHAKWYLKILHKSKRCDSVVL